MRARTVLGFVLLVAVVGLSSAGEDEAEQPALLEARIDADEVCAIATLRNLSSAQAQFQASAHADEDNDGTGEFGSFAELSAALPVRGTKHLIIPPVLSNAFKRVTEQGTVHRAGYIFAIYLPGKKGVPVKEGPGGGIAAGVLDPDLAAGHWLAYAWPEKHGKTGRRTFVINQAGDVYATRTVYSGEKGPAPTAAFAPTKSKGTPITGRIVTGKPASDGLTWGTRPGRRKDTVDDRGVRAYNELCARFFLAILSNHQTHFRLAKHVDEDGNGVGESGTFGELSGARRLRGTKTTIDPALLPDVVLAEDGTYRLAGYRFAIWLPGPTGVGVRETMHGLAGGRTDPDLAETYWIVYAWPEKYGKTADTTFVVTQTGHVLYVATDRYSGDKMPEPGAAFQPTKVKLPATMTGFIATDRSVWTQVN